MRWAYVIIGCILLFLLVWAVAGRERKPSAPELARIKSNGNNLVSAIGRHKEVRGHLPSSLAVLVPDYVSQDALTFDGEPWEYDFSADVYMLRLDLSDRYGWYRIAYWSKYARWETDTGF